MIATLLFILFSYLSGYAEAYFWNSRPKVKQLTAHATLTVIRSCLLIPVFWYEGLMSAFLCMMLFPFIHDGKYYATRNDINSNVYKKRWFDSSLTTGAIISFNSFERISFAVIGVVTFVIYHIIK